MAATSVPGPQDRKEKPVQTEVPAFVFKDGQKKLVGTVEDLIAHLKDGWSETSGPRTSTQAQTSQMSGKPIITDEALAALQASLVTKDEQIAGLKSNIKTLTEEIGKLRTENAELQETLDAALESVDTSTSPEKEPEPAKVEVKAKKSSGKK